MNCNEVIKLLHLYIDNMLQLTQMKAVSEHLDHCSACRQEYQEITQMLSLLANIEELPLPEEFDLKLHSELKKEAAAIKKSSVIAFDKSKRRGWKRISSIAAVFVVGLFSVLLYNNLDGFNLNDLGDTYNVETISEDPQKKSSITSNIAEEEVNNRRVSADSETDFSDELVSPIKNSMVEQSPDSESDSVNCDTTTDEVPQMSLKASNLSGGSIEESTQRSTETLVEDSNEKQSCNSPTKKFNPSRFLQALSEEDAKIYKELINAGTTLSSGRDSIAAIYYVKQLKQLLGESKYELVSCFQEPEGLWNINISIVTIDEDGNERREDVIYCGQDGELWKKELSLLTETV